MAYINLNEFLDNLVVTQKYCAQQLSRSLQLTLQYEPSDPEQFTNRQKYEIAVRRHYTKAILRSTNQGDNMKIVDLGYIALSQLFPVQLKLKKKTVWRRPGKNVCRPGPGL